MYRVFKDGDTSGKTVEFDTITDGSIASYTNTLSQVELSLERHRLTVRTLGGQPVSVRIENEPPNEYPFLYFTQNAESPAFSTLRRRITITSAEGTRRLIIYRNTPLIRR